MASRRPRRRQDQNFEDEDPRSFTPVVPYPVTNTGDGIGIVTDTLQTAGRLPNEQKPLTASRTAEEGIPDKTVKRVDVFPGWPSNWINNREWRLPKEASPPERLLDYFQDIPVRMTYVKDPSHFYVIREDEYEESRTFCQKVGISMSWVSDDVYEPGSRSNMAVMKVGNSDVWRRLEILEYIPNQRAYIRFIDDGETTTVNIPSTNIWKLDASYKDEPGFAILCSLDVEPIGDTWPETVLSTLRDFMGQVVKVRCIKQTRGFHVTHIVKMFLPGSDTDFGTTLVEGGLAKKRRDIPGLE